MFRSVVLIALATAALIPTTATAAKAPQGTYNGTLADQAYGASITVDKGRVIGLSFTWMCNDKRVTTSIVMDAAGTDGPTLPVKKNRFSVKRTAVVSSGNIGEPGFESGKGPATASARFNGSTWTGSFSGGYGGCTSGTLTFTAKRA
jgi:hypothetical protein